MQLSLSLVFENLANGNHALIIFFSNAIKEGHIEPKGAGGNLLCMCCRSVVSHTSSLADNDSTGTLVSSLETDITRFDLHSDLSIMGVIRTLQREHGRTNLIQFTHQPKSQIEAAVVFYKTHTYSVS